MLLKLYSIFVLLLDILVLQIRVIAALLEYFINLFIPAQEKSVAGEVVLITGTGHGIGRELAKQYAALGATVVCVDVNKDSNEETAKLIRERGIKKVHTFQCDVTDRSKVIALIDEVTTKVGPVTVLVNNAGIMPCHSLLDHKPEEIKKIFEVNVFAHFWFIEGVLPRMIKNNHGHIVSISSMAGVLGSTNLVPYCGSKFAVRGYMEALHEELRESNTAPNVYLTCVYPYMVDTGLCKKPRIRFPGLFKMVTIPEAASSIISAMRKNILQTSIPSPYLHINDVVRCFPVKVGFLVKDFLDVGVEAVD